MSSNGRQIFLSYGHRDATEVALRLRDDLEANGYSVWQDEKRIRGGHGAGHRWKWDDSTDTRPNQTKLALVEVETGAPIAQFPELRGFVKWHPSGRIWCNHRSRQVLLLQLEGEPHAS
jgi:hypothetical protein